MPRQTNGGVIGETTTVATHLGDKQDDPKAISDAQGNSLANGKHMHRVSHQLAQGSAAHPSWRVFHAGVCRQAALHSRLHDGELCNRAQ